MNKTRKLWVTVTILGLLTAALAGLIFPYFPENGYAISAGYGGAVYAFEMARVPADLIAVFGPKTDPEHAARIAAMDKGNLWDYAFMPAYALFMTTFLWAAYQETGRKVWTFFAGIGLLSGFADAIENAILLGITANFETAPFLSLLAFPVWIKFFSITLAVAAAGIFIFQQKHVFKIAGLLTALSMIAVFMAFYDASRFGALSGQAIGIAWGIMLIYAASKCLIKTP